MADTYAKILEQFGIDDYESLKERLSRLNQYEAEESKRIDEQAKAAGRFEEVEAKHKRTLTEKERQITALRREKDELDKTWQQKHSGKIVSEALTQAFLQHGGYEKAVGDAVLAMRNTNYKFEVDDMNRIVIYDQDGSLARDEGYAELSIDTLAQKFLSEHSHFNKNRLAGDGLMQATPDSPENLSDADKIRLGEKMKAEGKTGIEIAKAIGLYSG